VFTHLLTFFSRYYDKGDFISQRRFKGETYAIPYAGEEVVLHWANKDQYYTKSGENFSNYGFKLDDGRTIRFRLVTADTAKDNRKDNDKERRFVLIEPHTRILTDDDGDEYEEELLPVAEENGELVLRFEYKAMPKGSKQEDLVAKAVKTVLDDANIKAHWLELSNREPTEKNPQRTLLEKCLTNYTTKNTADYFINKDLGGFLRRELDFYIKNEVMHLDDVQNAEMFADIEKNLRLIQTLRAIALDLITFLAQLEDFQKKLWLKKKFVVATHYCVTLDRVPESLYPTIAANPLQWDQWDNMGMLDVNKADLFKQAKAGSVEYLKEHPYLMADTALFDAAFKQTLLAAVDNLDEGLDGLLIHGDNFQVLNMLQERYREQVGCIYIDPPYNTSEETFIYKNQYKHSSWLSMIDNPIRASMHLMRADTIIQVTIDDMELYRLKNMLDSTIGEDKYIGTIAIQSNPRGRGINSFFSTSHDYAVAYANNPALAEIYDELLSEEQGEGYKFTDEKSEYRLLPFRRSGGLSTPDDRPNSEFTLLVDPRTMKILAVGGKRTYHYPSIYSTEIAYALVEGVATEFPYSKFKDDHGLIEVSPIDSDGARRVWRWSDREKILKHARDGEFIVKNRNDNEYSVQLKDRIKEGRKPKTVWVDSKYDASSHGTNLLAEILGDRRSFGYPKSLYSTLASISAVVRKKLDSFVLDYFAGSGTTGHAVIFLNRQDKGHRKYILVEQGEYFDTVLKPRIQKIVYSADWKNGKATAPQTGISHTFKVLKIESYEDTLNNLQLRRTAQQQELLDTVPKSAQEDYLLRYLLDIESRGSLLSVVPFEKPKDSKLKVTVDSAGAYEERTIDLVETFNYLIGLRVKHIDMQRDRGFVLVTGWLPSGEKTLVLWRDVEQVDYETLNRLCDKLAINPADSEFEVVYINGDHNIPAVFTSTEVEGGMTKTLKIRQIEPEFLSRMFAVEEI